ncbi:hypothetical protein F5X98DRAFT_328502 [Xylaria grammica]|nr:hypothetical protein F5X98DRAFT_328502 [Xylaria grammica]
MKIGSLFFRSWTLFITTTSAVYLSPPPSGSIRPGVKASPGRYNVVRMIMMGNMEYERVTSPPSNLLRTKRGETLDGDYGE